MHKRKTLQSTGKRGLVALYNMYFAYLRVSKLKLTKRRNIAFAIELQGNS